MPQYEVGKLWWFPELGEKPPVGSVVELEEAAAERYLHNEPGLLAPVRLTAQAHPQAVRDPSPKTPRGRRPRARS